MFESGEIDEQDVDETHFTINMDEGTTFGFCGEVEVKYADVVSGGEGITILVRLIGGRDARIEALFLIFKKTARSYPIRCVLDDFPGVSYRRGPKGWMDTAIFPSYFRERRVMRPLPNGRKQILFFDNFSGHNVSKNLTDAR